VRASAVEKNVVLAPSGLAAAKLLRQRFGTPYELGRKVLLPSAIPDVVGKRVLVVDQQVAANELREELLARGAASVVCATWFMQVPELTREGDVRLREEDDFEELVYTGGFDVLVGDPTLWRIVPTFTGETVDVPQFPVSGKLMSSSTAFSDDPTPEDAR
jgi:hypothetical protein